MILDSFSGAASDLKGAARTDDNVLAVLAKHPRVSTWDMSEHGWLRDRIASLKRKGAIEEVESEPYPWHRYRVVAARDPS